MKPIHDREPLLFQKVCHAHSTNANHETTVPVQYYYYYSYVREGYLGTRAHTTMGIANMASTARQDVNTYAPTVGFHSVVQDVTVTSLSEVPVGRFKSQDREFDFSYCFPLLMNIYMC